MRTCACLHASLILHSSLQFQFQQQRYRHYLNLPSFSPIRSLFLSHTPTTSLNVIPRDIEVELSSSDSNDVVLSINENPTIEPHSELEQVPPSNEVKSTKHKKKKEQNDDNSTNLDNRFKLRNGKQVRTLSIFNFTRFTSILFSSIRLSVFRFLKRKRISLVLNEKVMLGILLV